MPLSSAALVARWLLVIVSSEPASRPQHSNGRSASAWPIIASWTSRVTRIIRRHRVPDKRLPHSHRPARRLPLSLARERGSGGEGLLHSWRLIDKRNRLVAGDSRVVVRAVPPQSERPNLWRLRTQRYDEVDDVVVPCKPPIGLRWT